MARETETPEPRSAEAPCPAGRSGPRWGHAFLLVFAGAALGEAAGWSALLDGEAATGGAFLRLAALGGGALFALLYWWRFLAPVLRSLRFGIAVLLFLLAASLTGTLFPQRGRGPDQPGYTQDFFQAEAAFLWNLTHPLARMSSPPRDRREALAWLEARGVPRPEKVLASIADEGPGLLGPDLAAQERIFGPAAARAAWQRTRSSLRSAVAEAGAMTWLVSHHGFLRSLLEVADALSLTRIWHSGWFSALVALLALGLALNLARPGPMSWRKLGFWLTHGGILIILAGGVVSRRFEERGFLPLRVGQVVDRYEAAGGEQALLRGQLAVGLEAFRAVPHYRLQISVEAAGEVRGLLPEGLARSGFVHSERVREGAVLELLPGPEGKPRWRVTVQELMPRVANLWEWVSAAPGQAGQALIRLARLDSRGRDPVEEILLTAAPGEPGLHFLPGGLQVALVRPADEVQAAALARGEGLGSYGTMSLRGPGQEWVRVALSEGETAAVTVPEGTVRIQVWRVMQDFSHERWGGRQGIFGERLAASQPVAPERWLERNRMLAPSNPAAALVLDGPRGVGGLYVFSGERLQPIPVPGHASYPEVEARLDFDRLRCPARERLWLAAGPAGLQAIRFGKESVAGAALVAQGDLVSLGEERFRIVEFRGEAVRRPIVEPAAGPEDLYALEPAGVRLQVEGPGGVQEVTLVGAPLIPGEDGPPPVGDRVDLPGGLALRFVEDRQMPQEWFSRLRVHQVVEARAMTREGQVMVVPVLGDDGWRHLLQALREAGADVDPLVRPEEFAAAAKRRRHLDRLGRALDQVLAAQPGAYWRERLPAELFVPLATWIGQGRGIQVAAGDVRVNAPLRVPVPGSPKWLLGYQLNQSQAEAREPDFSGLQVIWDPGVQMVRVGLVLTALGTILVLLVLPARRGFRREEGTA